ncbi:MAG TPA: anti-sigma factor [Gaiellaceae bacterium]|nr:anti-sigma factor [Gaiellaceae bacterium]
MVDDLHTLSAPYALDALTAEERALFEEHLSTCERCRAELAGLADAASSLAFAVEGPEPPAELRGRILAAARSEPSNVVPLRPRRPVFALAAASLAAVAAAAAVGLGVWAGTLHHSLSREQAAVRVLGNPSSRHIAVSGAKGELVVAPSGQAVLALRLPAAPKGKTYEAWVASPQVHRAGEFAGGTTVLPVRVPRGARVMVTVERAGGVDAPTSHPVLVAQA